ncbi:hypothetical protein [Devosia salina]|uniref:Uncharacterized protein n=1 Tax=Devosia salina TaxID=2860336 RepID=A0ABX8WFS7_9HYPH|nr:hypothetical protein [Devosia salina]QYO77738.1 hypothetical protein K1X15_03990 [Devosia salina]
MLAQTVAPDRAIATKKCSFEHSGCTVGQGICYQLSEKSAFLSEWRWVFNIHLSGLR